MLLVLIWLIDVINFKIYLQSSSKATADREKKRGEDKTEIQNCEYLKNEKSFLDEIRIIFHNYLRTINSEKMENCGHKLF